MFLKVSSNLGSLGQGGMLFKGTGELRVVRALVVQCLPWVGWILPDLHGFCKWVFDALGRLEAFVKQVVTDRSKAGLRWWATCLREDLGARPCAWLWADSAPPSRHLVLKDPVARTSRILVERHLIDAEFRKAWMPFFCRSGYPVVTVDQCVDFVDPFLSWEAVLDLPRITGQDLLDTARTKKSSAGGLDGWVWNVIKALPFAWFSGLAILLIMVDSTVAWP